MDLRDAPRSSSRPRRRTRPPCGDQGPAGNDGKNGTNGVSGYYIQWNSNYVSGSGDVHWLYAYCNYGDKVLGGGYVITSGLATSCGRELSGESL
jgi:hypothetical protein